MVSHNDLPTENVTLARPLSFHKGLLNNISDGNEHTLKDFLQRPVPIKYGDWLSTQAANTEILNVQIPLEAITASKAISQKISGFLGFRAKTVLRLQVNTNRFQQGRLMMTFFPQPQISCGGR